MAGSTKTKAKLIANANVLAWAVFWVFGYIAVTSPVEASGQMVGATLIAFAGLALGVWCYLKLVRGQV